MSSTVMKKSMYWFALPALIFYLTFWIFPILRLFQYSITDYNGYAQAYNYIGFDNYKELFRSDILGISLKNTLIYTFVTVIAGNIIGLAMALLLNMKIRGTGIYRSLAYIPTLFSAIVVGFLWSYVYMPDYGLISSFLDKLGIANELNFLGDYSTALYSIIFVEIWKTIGTTMIIFLAGLQTVPSDLLEARTD